MSWREWLGNLSGYKQRYEQASIDIDRLVRALELCRDKLDVYETQWQPETEVRDAEWLHGVIKEKFSNVSICLLDNKYWFCSKEDMRQIIKEDWTDNKQYISDRFDCEDFARQFAAHLRELWDVNQVAVVYDWTARHSFNIIFFSNGDAWIFEPQNDKIYPFDYRDEMYQLENSWLEI